MSLRVLASHCSCTPQHTHLIGPLNVACRVRGRLTFGLYGESAPLATERFKSLITGSIGQFGASGGGPSYSFGTIDKLRPGTVLEGGKIAGLRQVEFAGALEYEWASRLLPLRPVIETNGLRHTRRGLLTHERFKAGPEFGVTLAVAPELDGGWEVLGEVLEDPSNMLGLMEGLPYVTGRSLEVPGSAADTIWNLQRGAFLALAKSSGDKRAVDRTGQLLRRVEIVSTGIL